MSLSAYETTFGKHYDMREIRLRIEEQLYTVIGSINSTLVYPAKNQIAILPSWIMAVNDRCVDVPQFAHPLTLDGTARNPKERYIVVDVRPYTTATKDGDTVIKSKDDFDFAMLRAGLQYFITKNHPSELQSIGNFPMGVFIRWISEAIARKLGLNPHEQMRIAIITGALYNSMFNDPNDRTTFADFTEREKIRIATSISKTTMIPAQNVLDTLDSLSVQVHDIASYCECLAAQSDIMRLERFNVGLLQQLVGGGWFGTLNSREMVIIALEHPPTFFAMVYAAITNRSFKKCHLTTVVEITNKKGLGDDWVRGLTALPDITPTYRTR